MSIFNDNITSEISQIEKIRYWFRERILERFEAYNNMHQTSPKFWDVYSLSDDGYVTDLIHRDLATMWVKQCDNELHKMGVFSTCTIVKKKIGINKFCIKVRFVLNESPSIMFPVDDLKYGEVEVKDLKF